MRRAAYVCADPGVPVFGRKGCSVHVQEMVRALSRRGVQLHLFAANPGGAAPADLRGIRLHPLPVAGGSRGGREGAELRLNHPLHDALRREGPFDFVYERYSLWSFAGMEYARASGVPGLLEVNAPLIEEAARHRGLVNREQAQEVAERVFQAAGVLLPVSPELARYVRRSASARARVEVITNAVDPARFPPGLPATLPGPPGGFTIGFVGSLRPWHGLTDLATGFAGLCEQESGARLLVVGDGPERSSLERDLARRGLLERTTFTGAVAPDQVPGLLASMDAALAPYPAVADFYFSPLKLFEYMASGRAIVASRIGQVAWLIRDGWSGLLYEPGDLDGLVESLLRLRRDAALRQRLGREARLAVTRDHTWDAVARRVLALARAHREEPRSPARAAGAN